MKTALLLGSILFGTWFWQRPASSSSPTWPNSVPVFSGGRADCSYTLKNGSTFVSFSTLAPAVEVLSSARTAFTGDGWFELPLAPSDTLFFLRGESIAAILAESTDQGTRVTVLQHPKGL